MTNSKKRFKLWLEYGKLPRALRRAFIFVLLCIIIAACSESAPDTTPEDLPVAEVPDEPAPETPETPDDPESPVTTSQNAVKLALYDGSTLRLWDGETLTDAYIGAIREGGDKKLSIENVLYYFDEYGEAVHSEWLPVVPDHILVDESGIGRGETVYEDDVFVIEDITPEEAYALGGLYKHYTRVYKNGEEMNAPWYMNQWWCTDVIQTSSGHILGVNEYGSFVNLTDDKDVYDAEDGGLLWYDMGTEQGNVCDESGEYHITWVTNHFDNGRWQLADGVWYSENGFEWTAAGGVVSDANAMYCWNNWTDYSVETVYDGAYAEKPYMLPAGVWSVNGEECTYWIECNTGQLYRHIPSIDSLEMIIELYDGPGTRMGGIPYFNSLDPVIIDGVMYYHESNAVKTFDLSTTLISVFSADMEVIEW